MLLLLIPAVILTLVPYFRSSKKYRKNRNRILSMVFHGLAMLLAINLLAGVSFSYEKPNLENEIIILVDVSDSNGGERELKDEFVSSIINISNGDYRLGVVKFGHGQDYSAELSYDTDAVLESYLTSLDPNPTATDLASALKYAATLFKNPKTAKIVVVSDGVETDNAATSVIKGIASDGIRVDTAYFPNAQSDEVQIYSVKTPDGRIVIGENFMTEIVVKSNVVGEHAGVIAVYDNGELVGQSAAMFNGAEQVIQAVLALEERGLHELTFEIMLDGKDTVVENNSYRAFINLEAFDNILMIERTENEGLILDQILADSFKVTRLSISEDFAEIPRNIYEFAKYEQVILVNIAYSDMPAGFEENLNYFVHELGGGLLTVGGANETVDGKLVPHAYNRNDIDASTYLKQMLPVNVVDYTPPVAVMILVDASGSMSMGKLDAAKLGAEECLNVLSDRDYCGVMSFESQTSERIQILPISERDAIRDAIKNIGKDSEASGGTVFSYAIEKAGNALAVMTNVQRKHIVIVTDGNPTDSMDDYGQFVKNNLARGITMSIVTIDGDNSVASNMETLASAAGGSYYNIPYSQMDNIINVMRDDLTESAIDEIKYGEPFAVTIKDKTSAVAGIDEALIPNLTGYYGTLAKNDAKVPLMGKFVPIYAEWKYGKGVVGSFMCDLSGIWSNEFVTDDTGKALIKNIVNSIFPVQDVKADEIDVILKEDNYHFQLNVYGTTDTQHVDVSVTPISKHLEDIIEGVSVYAQESNRRFNFLIEEPGLYEICVKVLDENDTLVSETVLYKTFSYSAEYDMFPERDPIGEGLLTIIATDGGGAVITDAAEAYLGFAESLLIVIDPRVLFLILSIIFVLLDIAVRKFKFKWPHELIREYKARKAEEEAKNV